VSSRIINSSRSSCGPDWHRTKGGVCRSETKSFQNLRQIVQDYIDNHRHRAKKEMKWFGGQRDLATAIRVATLAINCHGKRHSHQRRIPRSMLEHFRTGLWRRRRVIHSCRNFPKLMQTCEAAAATIWKHSELTVYDTAHRIGAYLAVKPDRVYLHTGARDGARALGVKSRLESILRRDLPREFQRLEPDEVEDCLCIYKDQLRLLREG